MCCCKNGAVPLKIQYQPNAQPIRITDGWIDLAIPESIDLKAGTITKVSLELAIGVPEGYEAIIALRSSSPLKYGIMLANGIGIIDYAYRGPNDIISLLLYATRDAHIDAGTFIAQMRLLPLMPETRIEYTLLSGPNRGGFGSTDK